MVFGQAKYDNPTTRKCLYWEEQHGQWRLGQCLSIGFNFGCVGYTLNTEGCAVDSELSWDKACSDNVINGKLIGAVTFGAAGNPVESQTSTGALTTVATKSGRRKPKCTWKYKNGRFRCVKRRGSK